MKKILLGVTGASGTIYAKRVAEVLKSAGHIVETVISEAGDQVMKYEGQSELLKFSDKNYNIKNYFGGPASGTAKYDAMVVLPCSMGTMAKIAQGISDNLLCRAADVFLKERRQLIIVPREMPHNLVHLRNMEQLLLSGAELLPASPFFYNHPKTLLDLVDTVVGKILDRLEVDHELYKPWAEPPRKLNDLKNLKIRKSFDEADS
jgi:flavin prenyltransferase